MIIFQQRQNSFPIGSEMFKNWHIVDPNTHLKLSSGNSKFGKNNLEYFLFFIKTNQLFDHLPLPAENFSSYSDEKEKS